MTRPRTGASSIWNCTLTNQHTIKRNNRKAEQALHTLELAEVLCAVREGRPASGKALHPLWETLLVNQFHDILPGTCPTPSRGRSVNRRKPSREKRFGR